MKNVCFFLIAITVGLYGCGNESTQTQETQTEKKVEIDMDGPDFEIVVLSFSIEDSKTEIELTNRLDEAVKNVSGRLMFYGEDGNPLTRATGAEITSPFQNATNPHIVDSKSKRNLTLRNSIPEGTASIEVSEISVKTVSERDIKPLSK